MWCQIMQVSCMHMAIVKYSLHAYDFEKRSKWQYFSFKNIVISSTWNVKHSTNLD